MCIMFLCFKGFLCCTEINVSSRLVLLKVRKLNASKHTNFVLLIIDVSVLGFFSLGWGFAFSMCI